ncbi:MAG: hypothetical protein ACKOF9_03595 [Burkholderiales bacterium]
MWRTKWTSSSQTHRKKRVSFAPWFIENLFVSKPNPVNHQTKMPIIRPAIISLPVVFVLGACTPKYLAPPSGPTAEIRLKLESPEAFAMLHTYERPGCQGPQAIGVIGGPGYLTAPEKDPDRGIRPKMLGSSGKPDSQVLEVLVPADKRLTLLYSQIGPHDYKVARTCKLPISFVPTANEQYEVRYRYESQYCKVQVLHLSSGGMNGVKYTPVDNVARESDACSPTKLRVLP